MVYLRLQSIAWLAPPLIGSVVAGPSDHAPALKPGNGSASPSGLSVSPTSENLPSASNSIAPHPSESAALNSKVANLTDGPPFSCLPRYGVRLEKQICLDALESIPLDVLPLIFGRRTRRNIQIGLPYRFLSSDGTCAVDVGIGSFGSADADVISWAEIRHSTQRIIEDCVGGSTQRYPGMGGINRYLGQYGRLHVIVKSYDANVRCYDSEFDSRPCHGTLSAMSVSGNTMHWRPRSSVPVGRPNIFVPKSYTDPTHSCFATIRLSFGDVEQASYLEMWEGAEAVFWMCMRFNHDGVSTGHGRNGRLQVHLGLSESDASGADVQK